MKVESLDHIHIYSADPDGSASFYCRHFEAMEVLRNENVYGQERVFLSLGGQLIVLGPFPPGLEAAQSTGKAGLPPAGDGAYSHGFGVAHFGLRVTDVEAATRELAGAGVSILTQPTREDSGLCYAYLAAPDGVVVELTEYGRSAARDSDE